MSAAADRSRPAINGRDDAESLLAALNGALDGLHEALETQTAHVGAGRIRDGLANETRKGELSASYLLLLQGAKANVVALARFAPDALRAFRSRQAAFERVMSENQTVIATARAVSEGLIRGLAETVEREARPNVYGMPNRTPPVARSASPLVFSGRF